jgi:hypothetical protein
MEINLFGTPYGDVLKNNMLYSQNDFEFLKLLSGDFSLLYYNNQYDLYGIIRCYDVSQVFLTVYGIMMVDL